MINLFGQLLATTFNQKLPLPIHWKEKELISVEPNLLINKNPNILSEIKYHLL